MPLSQKHLVALAVAVVALVAVARTVATYQITAQGFDETCHIAAAMEWLDKHTYTLDPVHPPLARVAIGLPLYLAGERYPEVDPASHDYNVVGNAIIYGGGHYRRNLALARSGMLPFLVLAIVLVFFWARREFGDLAGILAAALFSTLPTVLAFSGMAYTDVPAACLQFAALFAFTTWLDKPSTRSTLGMGLAVGMAVLSKLTILLFFPAAVAAILLCKWIIGSRQTRPHQGTRTNWITMVTLAAVVAIIVTWAGYGFLIGHVRESMRLSPENMPSFQHLPAPARGIARNMVLSDWALPAPALLKGLATAWTLNQGAPPSYLLGHIRNGGWWYFFLVALAVKTPLPFLVLSVAGLFLLVCQRRQNHWTALAPAASAAGVLLVTMGVSYDAGLRHVMVVLPVLAVVAGAAAARLWQWKGKFQRWVRAVLAGLLLWQASSSFAASSDYIAYFNPLAGHDPSHVLIAGCDLDCGQDAYRLSAALRARGVSHASIAIWSSAEMSQLNLPQFTVLPPFQPVTGWVAVSVRALRFGDAFHHSYPPDSFDWLNNYQPVEHIGKTINLYFIPAVDGAAKESPSKPAQ